MLRQLEAISAEIAEGRSRENVLQRIVGAIHGLGFGRVRLDLLTADGKTLVPEALRGFESEGSGEPAPAHSDPDFQALRAHPVPQVFPAPVPRGCVPVLLQGQVIGKVTVEASAAGSSLDPERLGRVMPFAHLASLARVVFWAGSLETLQETTRAIIAVRNRDALLRTIVEQSVKLLGARSGGLYEYRPEWDELTVIADFNRPHHLNKTLKRGEGLAGKLLGSGETSRWTRDYRTCPDRAETYAESTFGAVLVVLLISEGEEIGALYVDDMAGRGFSEMDIRLLRLFADQAAICLTHSGLVEKDQRKLRRLGLLAQVTQEMVGDLDAMSWRKRLETIARSAADVLEAETSGVFRVRGNDLVLEASVGHQGEFEPGTVQLRIHNEPGGGLTGWIAHSGKLFNDYGARLKNHYAVRESSEPHAPSGFCYSLLAIPLKRRQEGKEEELIGLLRADNKKGADGRPYSDLRFTQEDEEILTIFADAAAIAIESAELVDRLKEQRDSQERLISSSPDGIIAVDRQGRVTDFNRLAQEILGYSLEEVKNMWVGQLYHTPEVPFWIGQRLRESEDHYLRGYETLLRSKSGEEIPILHSSTWLFNSQGERVGSVGYFEDLRKQKAMERRESLLVEAMKVLADAEDLDHGLQSLVQLIVAKLGRSFCGILLMNEEENALKLRAESLAGNPEWRSKDQRIELKQWRGLGARLKRGDAYEVARSDPRFPKVLDDLARVLGFDQKIYSLLVVPLKLGDQVIGQLDLGELKETGAAAFSKEEIELVSAIASQVTSLIHRFQLLARREKLLTALVEASKHIRAETELPALAQSIVRLAAGLVDCRVGGLYLHRRHLGQLDRAAAFGVPEDLMAEYLTDKDGLLGQVAQDGEARVHPNPLTDDLFLGMELESVAIVPCVSGTGDVEAVLFVGDSTWRRIDLDILESFATQATIALRTAGLIDQEALYLSQIAVLQRIGRYVQETERLDLILHAVLTGVTAGYGLGFNRAMLLLVDKSEERLVGELGIGEVERSKATESWRRDAEHGLDNFANYLDHLNTVGVSASTVGRKLQGFSLPIDDGGVFSEILESKAFRKVDVDDLPRVPRPFRDRFQVTTPLAVAPLVGKGDAIGLLVADNKFTQMPIGSKLADALMAFAATAAVAIENRRVFEQTRSNAERLSAFYQMSGKLVPVQDPKEILSRISDYTVEVAGASWVSVLLIDGAGRVMNPVRSGPQVSESPKGPVRVRPDGISMKVMAEGHALFFENVERERNADIPPNPTLLERGAKAAICLPLALPGKRIGVMWIHYSEPRLFPESDVAALQLYVNQAATAYDSARRLEKLEKLRTVFEDLAEAEDASSVLRKLLTGAQQVLKADHVVFWAFEKTTNSFLPEDSGYFGPHEEAWKRFQAKGPRPAGTAAQVMTKEWLCVEDVEIPERSQAIGTNTREFLQEVAGRGFQGVALKVGREKLGALYAIYAEPCLLDEEERDTARAFAYHAALALKKAKLFQQVQRVREAADMVARVTLKEDHTHALMAIASEIRDALDCSLVVLFRFDQDARDLIRPTTIAGEIRSYEEGSDRPLVFAMLEHDAPHIVADVEKDPLFQASPFTRVQGIKACVAIPLKAARRKVGVLFVSYRHRHRFTAEELATMELFANQAAVAIHNEQLFGGLSAKLAQQELLAGLSKELLGVSSVQATMDGAVAYTARFFNVEYCNLVLPDRERRLRSRAVVGWEGMGDHVFAPGTGSQTGFTIQEEKTVVVHDYSKEKRFAILPIVGEKGVQSGMSAPMFREGKVIGAILVHTTRPRRFTEEDELLMGLIADQTALALERAEQYEKSQRQSDYLKALNEANKTITASLGMDRRQLLEKIVQPTMKKMVGIQGPSAILGTILLYDQARDELILDSVYPEERRGSLVHAIGDRWNLTADPGVTGRAVKTGEPQLVPDVTLDPDYREGSPDTRSELAVPLWDRDYKRVVGVLNAESDQPNAFDEEDVEALKTLAELAVIAIQNARRVEEMRTQTDLALIGLGNAWSQHELNNRLSTISTSLKTLARRCRLKIATSEFIDDTLQTAISDLGNLGVSRPQAEADEQVSRILVNDDLIVAYQDSFIDRHPNWASHLKVELGLFSSARIRGNVEWLFKVLDILVHNAIRASAKTVVIGSRLGEDSMVEVYVEDDGPGIPPEIQQAFLVKTIRGTKGLGTGALIAKTIVQKYGGKLDWRDLADGERTGTRMLVSFPLEVEVSQDEILEMGFLAIDPN
ncbi:MAG TPA: GAF domain-containing protein [Thermoanaerobaculia bacterium]